MALSDSPSPVLASLPSNILFNRSFLSIGFALRSATTTDVPILVFIVVRSEMVQLWSASPVIALMSSWYFALVPDIIAWINEGRLARMFDSLRKLNMDFAKLGTSSCICEGPMM